MATGLAALRVLIVDDNPQMRLIVGTVLGAVGVRQLYYAGDGRAGLSVVRGGGMDVVYVDYEMPGIDGLQFISSVRALQTVDRFLPIIMLTGHASQSHLAAARDCGVTEFLAKPVTATSILSRLSTVIERPRDFVDSPRYRGPDRRRRRSAEYSGPMRRATDSQDIQLD